MLVWESLGGRDLISQHERRVEAGAVGRRTLTAPAHGSFVFWDEVGSDRGRQCFPPRPTWDAERSHYMWRSVAPPRVPGRWRGGRGVLHTRPGWETLKAPSPCWPVRLSARVEQGCGGRGLQADRPWRLGLVNGNAVCRVVPRVGEGVRELAHTQAWAPWPVTHVAYVSTGSSCMVALPSPVGLSIPSGKVI